MCLVFTALLVGSSIYYTEHLKIISTENATWTGNVLHAKDGTFEINQPFFADNQSEISDINGLLSGNASLYLVSVYGWNIGSISHEKIKSADRIFEISEIEVGSKSNSIANQKKEIANMLDRLDEIRSEPREYALYAFQGSLDDLGLKYEDVGTSEAEITALTRQARILQAKEWLQDLKTKQNPLYLDLFRNELEGTNITLHEAGTSSDELKSLERQAHLTEARKWLDMLKSRLDYIYIDLIESELKNTDITLEEVGTSSGELQSLLRQSQLAYAKKWLEHLKSDRDTIYVDLIENELEGTNITWSEIGTTFEEFQSLKREAYLKETKLWLNKARDSPKSYRIDFITRNMNNFNINPEEIGTSDEELKRMEYESKNSK